MVMMLMKNNYLERAAEVLEEYEDSKYIQKYRPIDYEQESIQDTAVDFNTGQQAMESLLRGYSGYFLYLQWLGIIDSSHQHEKDLAENAFNSLSTAISLTNDSNLSMFLCCLVRINRDSEFECADELFHLFKAYTTSNPHDFSAQMLFKSFLEERTSPLTKEEKRELRKCCKTIVKLSPSDLTTRDMSMSRSPSASNAKRDIDNILTLMDFLDYKQNMLDQEAWGSLVQKLRDLRETHYEAFSDLCCDFEMKMKDYWRDVHFNSEIMSRKDSDTEVDHHKNTLLNMMGFS
jgi:hypothetical protein